MKRIGTRPVGVGLTYSIVILFALCALASFAVDMGRVVVVKTQLRAAADAAALAAANDLRDPAIARTTAISVAKANNADGSPVVLDGAKDVEFGTWSESTRTFTPAAAGTTANAVRVTAYRSTARGNPINLPFAKLLGAGTCDVKGTAVAMASGNGFKIIGIDYVKMTGNTKVNSVATNGSISMTGSATVQGDAFTGNGGVKGGRVTGNRNSLAAPLVYPPAQGGSIATSNDNYRATPSSAVASGSIRLSGQKSVTLPAGKYYFKDIILTGGASVVCTGPVEIYLTGTLSLTGNTITYDNLPNNLKIFVLGTGKVTLTGTTGVYAEIYAPNSPVTLTGNGEIAGSVVGKSISLTGNATVREPVAGTRNVKLDK